MQFILKSFKRSIVVAEKDARIYYLKAPVLIFGILFPCFLFLAFIIGRKISPDEVMSGLIAMTLFFTASSVGPLVTPWERNAKTYERLIAMPLPLFSILLGDVIAGFCYGALISVVPLIIGIAFFNASVSNYFIFVPGILIGSLCFACLGILLSSPATETPSQVMMLSAVVRFPIIFISGIFIPISQMPVIGRVIALFSPLTYANDIVRYSFGQTAHYSVFLDFTVLVVYAFFLFLIAVSLHKKNLEKTLFEYGR